MYWWKQMGLLLYYNWLLTSLKSRSVSLKSRNSVLNKKSRNQIYLIQDEGFLTDSILIYLNFLIKINQDIAEFPEQVSAYFQQQTPLCATIKLPSLVLENCVNERPENHWELGLCNGNERIGSGLEHVGRGLETFNFSSHRWEWPLFLWGHSSQKAQKVAGSFDWFQKVEFA